MKNSDPCKRRILPIRDTLDLVGGKWKLQIVHELFFHKKRRFKELQRDLDNITSRMLSSELKQLAENGLVKREVHNTAPPTVEYSLTEYGESLKYVIKALYDWGSLHRERMLHGSEDILSYENGIGSTCGEPVKIKNKEAVVVDLKKVS